MTCAAELTVVIPTSGRWETLGRTLDALAAQSVTGFATLVVVDSLEHAVPAAVRLRPRVRVLAQEQAGPGVARNLAMSQIDGGLVLFLGDDTIPTSDLVARHLACHRAEPEATVAVLGAVRWHPEVARRHINRFLDWSGSQFDYAALDAEYAAARASARTGEGGPDVLAGSGGPNPDAVRVDAGFGRFYAANVSLKRSLLEDFDPAFGFAYEDIDLGARLAARGMVLRYEPRALALHHHVYTLEGLRRRFELVGEGERTMAAKHDWFTPVFAERFARLARGRRPAALWARLHDRVPAGLERLWWPVHVRAERWYHHALAESFATGWDRALDLEELAAYLGDAFSRESLWGHGALVEAEAARLGDEAAFYRASQAYLYDLTAFAMSGTKLPYHRVLGELVAPGARLLDYGAGIGADGLRLLARGYAVSFAEFDNPSAAFLAWRLARRGLDAPIHRLGDEAAPVPGGFDLAYAFDVIEHVEDPWAFLAELESRAEIVLVNLLEPVSGDISIHRPLPIRAILAYARRRGLLHHERLHGRSHLIAYRGDARVSSAGP